MISLARRFSAPTAALLAAAALPVWLHQATGATSDPCADPSALARLPAFGPKHSEGETPSGDVFSLSIDGELAPPAGVTDPLRFWVRRSLDPFQFYGYPGSTLVGFPLPEDRTEMHALTVGSDVLPVHRRYDNSLGATRFSQYALVRGVEPIRHPLLGGLAHVVPQLVRGTEPVTLFVIMAVAEAHNVPAVEAKADAWLAQAWTAYREACLP